MPWPEGEVFVDVLEAVEAVIDDCDGALDDGTVLEDVDVAGVNGVGEMTNFRTGSVARNAFSIDILKF